MSGFAPLGHPAMTAGASRLTAAMPDNMSSRTNDCCQCRAVGSRLLIRHIRSYPAYLQGVRLSTTRRRAQYQ